MLTSLVANSQIWDRRSTKRGISSLTEKPRVCRGYTRGSTESHTSKSRVHTVSMIRKVKGKQKRKVKAKRKEEHLFEKEKVGKLFIGKGKEEGEKPIR